MKHCSRFLKKLKNRAGETISETLVALLIASLALVMLASMISSTVNLVSTSKTKMNAYYQDLSGLENLSGADSTATITIRPSSAIETFSTISETIKYETTEAFSETVVAYEKNTAG